MWKARSSFACRFARDFSSRYVSMFAPEMNPDMSKLIRMNFPKRLQRPPTSHHPTSAHLASGSHLELSFLIVLAFPKASRMGLAWRSCCSNSPCNHGLTFSTTSPNDSWINPAVGYGCLCTQEVAISGLMCKQHITGD